VENLGPEFIAVDLFGRLPVILRAVKTGKHLNAGIVLIKKVMDQSEHPVVSIVMPCLNEAETLEACIQKARSFIDRRDIAGEIIVADNGSSDGSPEIARRLGARVVVAGERGYGNALRHGIEAARGEYVVMGDADDSYDFSSLDLFIDKLDQGYDLVVGNRFRGGIRPNAMPWLHRWVGNPILTGIGRILFSAPVRDFHCGLRAFRRSAYSTMKLQSTGMEFASEMVIQSTLRGLKVCEVPTTLYPDGRGRPSHLRAWRDGWRHLRFMLLFSPGWLFLVPSLLLLMGGGIASMALVAGPIRVGAAAFDIHTLLLTGSMCLIGYQLLIFGLFTKEFAVREGFHPAPKYPSWIIRYVNLEVGVALGCLVTLAGLGFIAAAAWSWRDASFGALDPAVTMRQVAPGAFLLMLGVQTVFSSFFLSILGMRRMR